jgi:hypothetical protein
MFNTIVGARAVGAGAKAGAASRYGSGSDQKMRLLAAPAPQHCIFLQTNIMILEPSNSKLYRIVAPAPQHWLPIRCNGR